MRGTWLLFLLAACGMDYNTSTPVETYWPPSDPPDIEAEFYTDEFHIATGEAVDILVVLDRSCSMVDDSYALVSNLGDFPGVLNSYNLDYRLAVMSADGTSAYEHSGELATYPISLDTPWVTQSDPEAIFGYLMTSVGGANESGNDAIFKAITEKFEINQSFFRYNVPLHIIMISDEIDQSEIPWWKLALELRKDEAIKLDEITYSAIVTLPGTEFCPELDTQYNRGFGYIQVALATGGDVVDICNPDWSQAYQQVAERALTIPDTFFLTHFPVESTIEVLIHNDGNTYTPSASDWTYDAVANSIIFPEWTLIENEVIEVDYQLR